MPQSTDLPPTDDFSYAIQPASSITLNINLTELPRCHNGDCQGSYLPVQYTTNPRSNIPNIYIIGWCCPECGKNFSYNAGKFFKQEILKEIDSQM